MAKLFDQATNPKQYDEASTGWKDHGGQGLENPSRRHMLWYLETIIPSWKGRKVLDVGTGSGWLLPYVTEHGATIAHGFDPSQANVDLGREQYGIEISLATLETYSPPTDVRYDTIIAIYVMSHIADLDFAFQQISKWLEPGGSFYIIVPDLEYAIRPRANFVITTEPIADSKHGDYVVSVKRDHGQIADIVRAVETYAEVGAEHGLEMVTHIPMKATDIMVNAYPRYQEMREQNVTLTHMLQFTKRAEG